MYRAIGASVFDGITGPVAFHGGVERESVYLSIFNWGAGDVPPSIIRSIEVNSIDGNYGDSFETEVVPVFGGGFNTPVVIEGNVYRFAFPAYANFTWVDNTEVGNARFKSILPDLFRDTLSRIPGDPAVNYQKPLVVEFVDAGSMGYTEIIEAIAAGEFAGAVGGIFPFFLPLPR